VQEFVVGILVPIALLLGQWHKKKAETTDDEVQRNRTSEDEGL
jgi:hypothetical protein